MTITFELSHLYALLPEISLATLSLILLMLGTIKKQDSFTWISRLSLAGLGLSAFFVLRDKTGMHSAFGSMFMSDSFTIFAKLLILTGTIAGLLLVMGTKVDLGVKRFEYPVLILLSAVGMLLTVSANDFMSLYMGLELSSLPLYVLAALQRETTRSTEAGIKYFILGALSSGFLLYGISLIYGFSGTTSFDLVRSATDVGVKPGIIFGMVFLLCGLAFKVSAVPFHMWTPDVYEGSPTPVTAFFALVPKVAVLAVLCRVFVFAFSHMSVDWKQLFILMSFASMALGVIAAVGQNNIKRLLSYSAIANMGYAIMGLAAGNQSGLMGLLAYMAIYMTATVGAFAVVLSMRREGRLVEDISDLAGLSQSQPMMALAMAVMMLSLAGIPPLAGFLGKLFVFQSAVKGGLYLLAIGGVLASVVGAYYYLRIIKVMYFDEQVSEPIEPMQSGILGWLSAASSLALIAFIAFPNALLRMTEGAATALMR